MPPPLPMDLLFAYGTLQVPDIMARVTGKRFQGIPAVLPNYRRSQLKDADYPGIAPSRGSETPGTLFRGFDEGDLDRLDRFEGSLYQRRPVTVLTAPGVQKTAWTYVVRKRFRNRLTRRSWHLEQFMDAGYGRFVTTFVERPWDRRQE
ncbi:MAG: gamma-glutamylcyclotransferase [Desulfobacterales bacterium]